MAFGIDDAVAAGFISDGVAAGFAGCSDAFLASGFGFAHCDVAPVALWALHV